MKQRVCFAVPSVVLPSSMTIWADRIELQIAERIWKDKLRNNQAVNDTGAKSAKPKARGYRSDSRIIDYQQNIHGTETPFTIRKMRNATKPKRSIQAISRKGMPSLKTRLDTRSKTLQSMEMQSLQNIRAVEGQAYANWTTLTAHRKNIEEEADIDGDDSDQTEMIALMTFDGL
ncbi:MAG: hypothetical protein Q9219_005322 [cf. Caloplaca sp. 3 TL-2023]